MKEDVYLKLLLQEPIYIKDMGLIYQPLIKDIVEIGEEKLNKYIGAISISKELLINAETKDLDSITNFDVIFSLPDKDYQKTLIEAIQFFTNQKVYFLQEVWFVTVGKQGRLHKNNYDEFVDIVLKMFNRQRVKSDYKRTDKMSEKQKEIYYKITKHRREQEEKNRFLLSDIINVVKHGGTSFITKEQIKNMTYFELMKCFETIISKYNYGEFLMYRTSPNFKVEESVQHWTISIKNNNE
ncbi:MAG: hypothetical protein N4A50_06270 [Vallitalea sp.]|jgi:hypothetical protein|nr:hypothetical protein [Vallitalea sp.]